LLTHSMIPSEEALALASSPGGCEGNRYPLFVELDASALSGAGYVRGGHMQVEFILPGKPGRWRAAGEIAMLVEQARPDAPLGLGLELLGLTLTGETSEAGALAAGEASAVTDAESVTAAPEPAFDASTMEVEIDEVAGMLADLLGRDVVADESEALVQKIGGEDLIAGFRDDSGVALFLIVLDKSGAARIGGSLTMLPPEGVNKDAKTRGPLEGEACENAGEVLNIMSALFHEAGAPHVALAETITGKELPESADGEFQALLDAPTWRLSLVLDIEEYGPAEVLLVAK